MTAYNTPKAPESEGFPALLQILLVSQACMASRPSSVMGKVSLPSISLFS